MLRDGGSALLRGLGDCRFERGERGAGRRPRRPATRWPSARPGRARRRCRRWRSASTSSRCVDGACDLPGQRGLRPDASGRGTAADALPPGFCPLSMLFSDWDGSGRRDLRVSNDRHYYGERGRRGAAVAVRARGAAAALHGRRRLGAAPAVGDGHRELRRDRRRLPEVYLTSQGANTLQTLVAGRPQPAYHDIARKRGVEATRPVAGGDPLPSTAWHPEFQDVNNDGVMDLFVTKGNVNADPRLRPEGPEQPVPRPAGRDVRRGLRGGRDRLLRPGPRRGAGRLQPRRPARPRRGRTSGRPSGSGATSAGDGRGAGADG